MLACFHRRHLLKQIFAGNETEACQKSNYTDANAIITRVRIVVIQTNFLFCLVIDTPARRWYTSENNYTEELWWMRNKWFRLLITPRIIYQLLLLLLLWLLLGFSACTPPVTIYSFSARLDLWWMINSHTHSNCHHIQMTPVMCSALNDETKMDRTSWYMHLLQFLIPTHVSTSKSNAYHANTWRATTFIIDWICICFSWTIHYAKYPTQSWTMV